MTDVQLFFDGDVTPVNQRSSVYVWDDFLSGSGQSSWEFSGSHTSVALFSSFAGANHPGIASLVTGSSSGNNAIAYLRPVTIDSIATMEWVFLPNESTSMTLVIGATNTIDGSVASENGFAVEYDTTAGDTALSLVKWVSGVRTVAATLAITAQHWYRMNWSKSGSGAGTLVLNDLNAATSQAANLSGLTGSAVVAMGGSITTRTAATRSLFLDWFQAALSGMAR